MCIGWRMPHFLVDLFKFPLFLIFFACRWKSEQYTCACIIQTEDLGENGILPDLILWHLNSACTMYYLAFTSILLTFSFSKTGHIVVSCASPNLSINWWCTKFSSKFSEYFAAVDTWRVLSLLACDCTVFGECTPTSDNVRKTMINKQ